MTVNAKILIFCKAPIAGTVKTRLQTVLSPQQAADLHKKLALETVKLVHKSQVGQIDVWCSPDQSDDLFQQFKRDYQVGLETQQGADLGERMQHALQTSLRSCSAAILIGTDCPSLTENDFRIALKKLETGCDVVIAPAEDGGFTLIGLRHSDPAIFDSVIWGSSDVYQQTLENINHLDLTLHELPMHWDIDRPEDMERYQSLIFDKANANN